jgi:hypothetical protein
MSIEGRIAVDVSFADSATSSGVQSLKRMSIADAISYTTGKVAIMTGTCGTAGVSISVAPTTYKDAAGNAVSFASVSRIAFAANSEAKMTEPGQGTLVSRGNRVCVTDAEVDGAGGETISINTFSGTASYTIVIYGT